MTDNQGKKEEKAEARAEVKATHTQPAAKVENPRVEDVKAAKPLTTPAQMNTVNPVANVDSIDPARGYDPNLPNYEVGLRAEVDNTDNDEVVDIKDKSKAEILMKLYNGAAPQGLGMLQATHDWTLEDAELYWERATAVSGKGGFGQNKLLFGDIFGRRIDVDLSGDEVDLTRYNNAHGKGAGQKAI